VEPVCNASAIWYIWNLYAADGLAGFELGAVAPVSVWTVQPIARIAVSMAVDQALKVASVVLSSWIVN
jgi:hypothetical protein